MDKFRFFKLSLAIILAMVGLKMLLAEPLKDTSGPGFNLYLLLVVLIIHASGVPASFWTCPDIKPYELLEIQHPTEEAIVEQAMSNVKTSAAEQRG